MAEDLWEKMAALTYSKCLEGCKGGLGSCCSREYCLYACEEAKAYGVDLHLDLAKDLPGIDNSKCVIPARYRRLCALHICERLLLGDRKFMEKYFDLREILSEGFK